MTGPLTIRLATESDSQLVHRWRNAMHVRSVSGSEDEIDFSDHSPWFNRVLESLNQEILLVEWEERPVAVVRMEDIDRDQQISSWGCYLGDSAAPPGIGGLLPYLGLHYGFETRHFRRMHSSVLSLNSNMLKIHRRSGIAAEGTLRHQIRRADGTLLDVVNFGVLNSEWPDIKARVREMVPTGLRLALDGLG